MEEVADRIHEIIKRKGISNSEMADTIDLPRPILSHILSGRNKPSLAVVQKIATSYTDVDLQWLLIGKPSTPPSINPPAPLQTKTEQEEKTQSFEEINEPAEQSKDVFQPERSPIETTRNPSPTKLVQIVHYFEDNTFKVFDVKP